MSLFRNPPALCGQQVVQLTLDTTYLILLSDSGPSQSISGQHSKQMHLSSASPLQIPLANLIHYNHPSQLTPQYASSQSSRNSFDLFQTYP